MCGEPPAQKKRLEEERLAREREAARSRSRRRVAGFAAAGLVAAAAVAGIVVAVTGGDEPEEGAGGSAPTVIADVHGIGVDPADGSLFIATHTGLFRSGRDEASARRVEAPEQDLMAFSIAAPDRFLASGHPGPAQDLPPALGLIESRDQGRGWRSVSLQGEADFHILRAAGQSVYGFAGHLMASRDGGRTWDRREAPGALVDIAPDPRDPDRVLASTGEGLRISADGGRSWSDGTLAAPALLAWGRGARVFAVDGEGGIFASNDGGSSWRQAGAVQGPPAAFTADGAGALYVARQDGSVDQSADGGRSWRPRSRN